MENVLKKLNMEAVIKDLIKEADVKLDGQKGTDKEEWVVNFAYIWLEKFDNSIPFIGAYLDLPLADHLEREAVKLLVKKIFDELNKKKAAKPAAK